MSELAAAYVTLIPSFKGGARAIESELGKSTEKAGRSTGSRFGKVFAAASMSPIRAIGAAALGLFAFDKATQFIGSSITAASDLNETISKSTVIFGRNAGAIDAWSRTAAASAGLSRQAALEAASSFGDMFSQIGIGASRSTKMSKNVVQLAADLGSFNNLDTAEVLDMISGAFRGEFDSLQRVIPNINAARVQTEALSRTHKKNAKDLTAAEKAQATLAIIQRDGARASGDYARTSSGLANSQKTLGANVDNLKASLGAGLTPVLAAVTASASTFVTQLQTGEGAGGQFVDVLNGIRANLGTIAPVVATIATGLVAYKVAMFAASVVTRIQAAATAAATAQTTLLNVALRANPIGLIITGLTLLGIGLVLAYKKSATFRAVVQGAFAVVKVAAAAVVRFFTTQVPGAFSKVVGAARSVFGWIRSNWPLLLAILTGPIGLAVLAIVKNWDKIITTVKAIPAKIKAVFNNVKTMLLESGKALIQGFIDGIKSKASDLTGAAGDLLKKARDFFPFSPAKKGPFSGRGWVLYSGQSISLALAEGIRSKGKKAVEAVKGVFTDVKSQIDGLMDSFNSLRDAVASAFDGDLFSATSGSAFMAGLQSQKTTLEQLLKSWAKLDGFGLSSGFLSSLFQSGNTSLINSLASGTQAQALSAQSLYGQVTALQNSLGTAVAKDQYGPQIVDRLDKLAQIAKGQGTEVAKALNKVAKQAAQKKSTKGKS